LVLSCEDLLVNLLIAKEVHIKVNTSIGDKQDPKKR
jgi:hypothetical protein